MSHEDVEGHSDETYATGVISVIQPISNDHDVCHQVRVVHGWSVADRW